MCITVEKLFSVVDGQKIPYVRAIKRGMQTVGHSVLTERLVGYRDDLTPADLHRLAAAQFFGASAMHG